jgi:nucleotide-binding universal stress UspA family protein
LEASEVSNEVIIREGRVRTTILQEAEAGDYDLVVLGASMPRTRRLRPWAGRYTHQLVRRIKQPVLVVPMS